MSLTLGEKLRQAREERGFTLGDVAEQTRISSLYLESIENDDYRILPGGIFNKGFVKSYAKFVGINEAEALSDYSALISSNSKGEDEDSVKVYRPEVLTDDRSSSMLPTIILAAVILGLMTAGILFLVNYIRQPQEQPTVAANTVPAANTSGETSPEPSSSPGETPTMESVKVEFKALTEAVSLTATNDGKTSSNLVAAGTSASFEPKESLKLSYSKSLANVVSLTINGKEITLPAQPLVPRRNSIEFEINKDNLGQIWTNGAISAEVPAASPVPAANIAVPADVASTPTPGPTASTPAATPVRTPSPRPTASANAATNSAPRPTPERRPAGTPAAQPRPPASNQP